MNPRAATTPPTHFGTKQVLGKAEIRQQLDRALNSIPPLTPFIPDEFNQLANQILQRTHPGALVQYLVTYGFLEQIHKATKDLPKINVKIDDRFMSGYQRAVGVLVMPLEGVEAEVSSDDEAVELRNRIIDELTGKILGMLKAAGVTDPSPEAMMDPVASIAARFFAVSDPEQAEQAAPEDNDWMVAFNTLVELLNLDKNAAMGSAQRLVDQISALRGFAQGVAQQVG